MQIKDPGQFESKEAHYGEQRGMLDYDKGFSNLCEMDKNVVQRLKILAGAITVPVGKKRKRMPSLFCSKLTINFYPPTGPEAKANKTTNGKKNAEPVFTKK